MAVSYIEVPEVDSTWFDYSFIEYQISLFRYRDSEARNFTTPHPTLLVSIRGSHIPDCPFPKEYLEIGRYQLLKASCRSFKSRFIPSQSEMIMLWVEGERLLTKPDAINIKSHQSLLV